MSDQGFDDVLFPLAIGAGTSSGPEWRTELVALASGVEVRNARWASSRRRWDVASAVSSVADLARLSAFFDARQGRLRGFRYRDLADHSSAPAGQVVSATDQVIGAGDGSKTTFQLQKTYEATVRRITKPVAGTVRIAVGGAELEEGWSVDALTGQISLDDPPAPGTPVTAGFEFDWTVRFDADRLDLTLEHVGAGRAISVPIIEIR
ncbi:MAG: DUF2460 domain-containing protein [Henriciella sp.]|uniref:DUF2460 domain-containing protein n=1 Tax=Henriciella sp. TaxID=1968823 RepID=UPI0032EE1697